MSGTDRPDRNGHSLPGDPLTVEWYTPPPIFDALGLEFDLDPCGPPGGLPWGRAARTISLPSDGLLERWDGRVWLNPPYGTSTGLWVERLAEHGDGIALVFARTDTGWWQSAAAAASAVCFVEGRLSFVRGDGANVGGGHNAGAPSTLLAFGEDCARAVAGCGLGLVARAPATAADRQLGMWAAIA
jgi:hypothetical protein